jgi:tRNA(Ile)-lysidine synthase
MTNRFQSFSATRLLDILQNLPTADGYLVGFSGGADSTALLYALHESGSKLETPFTAVHVNHGIHADSDLWQEHCKAFCHRYDIELRCLKVNPDRSSGKGIEAEARHLRYEAISCLLNPGDCLLTAHHADDQVETLLLNLMRGSGVDGLSAMPEHRPLGTGSLQRPLLAFANKALIQYLRGKDIAWLDDPSNYSLNHDRNFVRHEIIPLLESRWPGINKRILLTQKAMTETRSLLEPMADEYLEQQQVHEFVLGISSELERNPALFKLTIRRWLKKTGVPAVPARRLDSLYLQIKQSGRNQRITIEWNDWSLRFYKQKLWLQSAQALTPCPDAEWPVDQSHIDLGKHIGKLSFEGLEPGHLPLSIRVSNRKSNKGIGLKQGDHHSSLKNLFQTANIPAWLRDSIPLCFLEGELVAVGDWWLDQKFANWMLEHDVKFYWTPGSSLLRYLSATQHSVSIDRDS